MLTVNNYTYPAVANNNSKVVTAHQ